MPEPVTPRRPKKRIPLEVTDDEYASIKRFAANNGFNEVAPALRWALRKFGVIPVDADVSADVVEQQRPITTRQQERS